MCVCVRAREKEGFEIEKGPRREVLSRSPDKWAEFGMKSKKGLQGRIGNRGRDKAVIARR